MKLTRTILIAALSCSVFIAGCEPIPAQPSTSQVNAQAVEANQQRLQTVIPAPQLQTSLERKNLVERLERVNQQNMSGFIYLLSQGHVVASYAVRGKVTSLNSYLQAEQALTYDSKCSGRGEGYCAGQLVEQPDYDGAYGKNDDGVFFFTADSNAYVEWHGEYLFSDQPLKLNQEPLMVRQVND